jgi:hypothetical protein
MAEQLAGTAVIRVKLAISPEDRAILSGGAVRIPGAPGGGRIPGVPGGGGVPGIPGGGMGPGGRGTTTRGGGIIGGGMIGAAIALAYASPLGAPIMDAGRGVVNRSQQIGRDLSETLGVGGWARRGNIPGMATDATVNQLGEAANYATDEQIKALGAINEQLATLKVEGENKVRGVLGQERLEGILEKLSAVLDKLANFLGVGGKSSPRPGIG